MLKEYQFSLFTVCRYSEVRLINITSLRKSFPLTIIDLKKNAHKATQQGVKRLLEMWIPSCVKIISDRRDEIEECMPEDEVTLLSFLVSFNDQHVKSSCSINRELKQRRRRRQRQRCKTIGLMSKNNRSARAFTFWYISLPSSAKQQREMTTIEVLWRTWTHDGEFCIFFLNLYPTPTNSVPG